MATGYGMQPLAATGQPIRASVNDDVEWKVGGITLDWSKITAVVSDTTLDDGSIVKAGQKYLPHGTPLTPITIPAISVVNLTGSPTGGNIDWRMMVDGVAFNALAVAYNATKAALQTALRAAVDADSNVIDGSLTVTGTDGGPYTVTFGGDLASSVVVVSTTDHLTGGTSPASHVVVTNAGQLTTYYFAPYDAAATDGRATLDPSETCITDRTIFENPLFGLVSGPTLYPQVLNGGSVWYNRLQVDGAGQPTLAALKTAMPRLKIVKDH